MELEVNQFVRESDVDKMRAKRTTACARQNTLDWKCDENIFSVVQRLYVALSSK